jgi:hypothetical protein
MSSPSCPGAETLGAFLDGTLPPAEMTAMNEHLATCDDCMEVMRTASSFRREKSAAVVPIESRRRRWTGALAASVAIVLFGAALMLYLHERSASRGGIAALIDAAPLSYRRVEPRISGFKWAELRHLRASDTAPPDPESLRLGGVAGEVLRREQSDRSAGALHAAGVAELLIEQPPAAIERQRDVERSRRRVLHERGASASS